MKKLAKKTIALILGWQVRRLTRKNNFKVVAVTGSIGKTSTKLAVAHLLSQKYKVRYQKGNYNDIVFIPLVFFDVPAPNIFNPFAWLVVFIKNELALLKQFPYEIVVAELGTDAPGQVIQFKSYIKADLGILTAITPEHMENFSNLEAVAEEEMSIALFSKQLLINKDLADHKYYDDVSIPYQTYGITSSAGYRLTDIKFDAEQAAFKVVKDSEMVVSSSHNQITEPQLYSVAAAAAAADIFGLDAQSIDDGIKTLPSVNGRMQHIKGINDSTIIDDTYNASPEAVLAALRTLYRLKATQKIAVLGNMNELGKFSEEEHKKIGEFCDPKEINFVATIGPDANKFLAGAAESRGCEVKRFNSPYQAGEYIKSVVKPGGVILAKGSQNQVFAEETVKMLLADPHDSSKLVRQSSDWLKIKQSAFKE